MPSSGVMFFISFFCIVTQLWTGGKRNTQSRRAAAATSLLLHSMMGVMIDSSSPGIALRLRMKAESTISHCTISALRSVTSAAPTMTFSPCSPRHIATRPIAAPVWLAGSMAR